VITALEQKLDRAWAEELVADVRVNSVGPNPATGEPEMNLTFAQYEPGTDRAAVQKTMTLPGEEFYVDALVVKFDRKLVEEGDGLRGKSLLFLRRMFGDRQRPVDGVSLYQVEKGAETARGSDIPARYRVDMQPTELERRIWSNFWSYANNPTTAADAGVRVAQGDAPHMRAVKGQVYKVTLRASDGVSITPRLPGAMVGDADGGR
jgi:hypothetical protein